MSTKTIVLAEDDPDLRCLYTDYLGVHDFNVMAAADGLEALSLLHRVQPNLVLLDIMMPKLNGIETCRRARAIIGYQTPIVFLTALDKADQVKKGIEAGGDDYILKTSQLEVILERVKYWTSPLAQSMSESMRNKALEEMRAMVETQDPEACAGDPKDAFDKRADDARRVLERAIAAADSNFGGTTEQKLYFVGYVAGVVDCQLDANGSLEPRFIEYMRGALLTGGIMNRAQVEETMNTLNTLIKSEPVKNGWAQGRRDNGAADAEGPDFVPSGLAYIIQ